jgi:hypothetical protein
MNKTIHVFRKDVTNKAGEVVGEIRMDAIAYWHDERNVKEVMPSLPQLKTGVLSSDDITEYFLNGIGWSVGGFPQTTEQVTGNVVNVNGEVAAVCTANVLVSWCNGKIISHVVGVPITTVMRLETVGEYI